MNTPDSPARSARLSGASSTAASFDRGAEDLGNIVHMEHLNLSVADQALATQFYISALGLTRDPYMMTGVDNMWVNAGATQFHLPSRGAQRLRGSVVLVIPDRQALLERLQRQQNALAHTAFAYEARADHVAVCCPWGNRMRCVEPDAERFGALQLGIAALELDAPPGSAEGIARFYREILAAPARTSTTAGGATETRVLVGSCQWLVFVETSAPLAAYDGHHIQIYVADFSGPHRRLQALGCVSEESNQHQYRFLDLTDPRSGTPLLRLEHEVRSLTHPMYGRSLVNRNPAQGTANYVRGRDAFVP